MELSDRPRAGQIQVISRVGQILDLLARRGAVRVQDVSQLLGVERTSVHRYLTSLVEAGILAKGADSTYGVGPLVVRLFALTTGGSDVIELAQPLMQSVASRVHNSVALARWMVDRPVVSAIEYDLRRAVQVRVRVGLVLPLHSAQGKAFMAFADDDQARRAVMAPMTTADGEAFLTELGTIRESRISISDSVQRGIRAIASPVIDHQDRVVATLAIVGLESDVSASASSSEAQLLRGAAEDLSGRLGHRAAPSRVDAEGS